MSSILLQEDLQNLSQGKVTSGGTNTTGFGTSVTDLLIVGGQPILNDFAKIAVTDAGGNVLISQFLKIFD